MLFRGKTDESDIQAIKQKLYQSASYLAVPTNKTKQQESIREESKKDTGDSAGGQKKEQPSGSDKSTTSPNSPNVEGKPAENGIAAKTTTQ